jgi:excisionase family DNA binding protein
MDQRQPPDQPKRDDCSTIEAARWLGMAVRSVQLMVDRGELQAWKTPGGHRRISRDSIQAWLSRGASTAGAPEAPTNGIHSTPPKLLLIEDSAQFQNLVSLVVRQSLPHAELHVADDGIAGLALAGKLEPQLLIVDILLPGIDGATLITSLRSHPQFSHMALIVVTSLEPQERQAYDFALQGVPVIHKSRLVAELPVQLLRWAQQTGHPWATPVASRGFATPP